MPRVLAVIAVAALLSGAGSAFGALLSEPAQCPNPSGLPPGIQSDPDSSLACAVKCQDGRVFPGAELSKCFSLAPAPAAAARGAAAPQVPASAASAPVMSALKEGAGKLDWLFDGPGQHVAESVYGDDYPGSVRTPRFYHGDGQETDPSDRTFLTVSGAYTMESPDVPIQFGSYTGQWYNGATFGQTNTQHEIAVVAHLDALSDKLPFYVYGDMYTADYPGDYDSSLQADTFGAGVEKALTSTLTGRAEIAHAEYSGKDSVQGTVEVDGAYGVDRLRGQPLPQGTPEPPLLTDGLSMTASQNTGRLRWSDGSTTFTPYVFAHAWGTMHLGALNRFMPVYLTYGEQLVGGNGMVRPIETAAVGLEEAFFHSVTGRVEYGKSYYAGGQANVVSFSTSVSFTMKQLMGGQKQY